MSGLDRFDRYFCEPCHSQRPGFGLLGRVRLERPPCKESGTAWCAAGPLGETSGSCSGPPRSLSGCRRCRARPSTSRGADVAAPAWHCVTAPSPAASMTEGLCVIRTPNRGVAVAGAALGSVSLAVGVLGVGVGGAATARASADSARPRSSLRPPAPPARHGHDERDVSTASTTSSTRPARRQSTKAFAAERASITGQAAAVAAAAGSTKVAPANPSPRRSRGPAGPRSAPH